MKFQITPAAMRSAAATGLTIALIHAAAGAPAPQKKTRNVTVEGDKLSDTRKETIFNNAVVHDEDTKVTADQMVVEKDPNQKIERIIATGKARAVNGRNEITGDKMTVYPKERRIVVEGKVHGIMQPKPGEEGPPDENAPAREQVKDGTVDCDRLEYDYRNKNIAAQGNLKLFSRGRTVVADRATYIDKTEDAEFFGPVHYRDNKSRTFDTPDGLKLSLKKGAEEIHAPGKFKGTFPIDESDDETSSATPPAEGKTQTAPEPPSSSSPNNPAPKENKSH